MVLIFLGLVFFYFVDFCSYMTGKSKLKIIEMSTKVKNNLESKIRYKQRLVKQFFTC